MGTESQPSQDRSPVHDLLIIRRADILENRDGLCSFVYRDCVRKELANLDYERLLKLRLAIARLGEMENVGWWNTKGLLSDSGRFVFRRGFPTTYSFAQARAVFAVATSRCRELFEAPNCVTLWCLPAAVEEQFEEHWQGWLDEVDQWQPFFARIATIRSRDVLGTLRQLELVGEQEVSVVGHLPAPASSPSLRLSVDNSEREVDNDMVGLLAAAFARSEPGKLAVPYVQLQGREGR